MRIGIIGSGRIGGTLARLFEAAGHDVVLANSRGEPHTVEEAADAGDLLVLAIPLLAVAPPASASPARSWSTPTTTTPAATADRPPRPQGADLVGLRRRDAPRRARGEGVQHHELRAARQRGQAGAPREERLAIFLAGDDEEAKRQVAQLIDEIGFAPVDTGSLADSHRQEPGAPVYNRPMTAPEAERALRPRERPHARPPRRRPGRSCACTTPASAASASASPTATTTTS